MQFWNWLGKNLCAWPAIFDIPQASPFTKQKDALDERLFY